jgi:hypothetical protein
LQGIIVLTEILEEAVEPGEPFPVAAAKKAYQACMDTGKSLLDIPVISICVLCACLILYK